MVPDQGMKADDGFNIVLIFPFRGRKNLPAIFHAAFHEDRQRCRSHDPMAMVRHAIEPGAIGSGCRQEMDLLEIPLAESHSLHHRQKQFWMRFPKREASGFFLIDIFSQHVTNRRRRVLPKDSGQENGEVTNVHGVLMLKVRFESSVAESSGRKIIPGPVMLLVHDSEERVKKRRLFYVCGHNGLPSRWCVATIRIAEHYPMNPLTIQNPDDILDVLADVTLRGAGFTTESLLDYVLEEGFTEPIFLNASGEDPNAFFKGQPNAWAIYQIREWKRVLTISGGPGQERRARITETP